MCRIISKLLPFKLIVLVYLHSQRLIQHRQSQVLSRVSLSNVENHNILVQDASVHLAVSPKRNLQPTIRYFPHGNVIYLVNIGGKMQETVVDFTNKLSRVAVCGVIPEYTDADERAAMNMMDVINIQGFMATDHNNVYTDFVTTIAEYLRSGKILPVADISEGVESIPSSFVAPMSRFQYFS